MDIQAKSRLQEVCAAPRYQKVIEFVERAIRHAEPQIEPRRFATMNKEIYQELFDELGDSRVKVVEEVLTTVTDPNLFKLMLDGKSTGSRTLDSFAHTLGQATGALA